MCGFGAAFCRWAGPIDWSRSHNVLDCAAESGPHRWHLATVSCNFARDVGRAPAVLVDPGINGWVQNPTFARGQ
eukprot:11177941-Lingulodinium_polyedra.AAC.1